jgi:aldehyde dehydrogenase (NAD+)
MDTAYGLWIDGQERPSHSGEVFPVVNPSTQAVMGYAARANAQDADEAVLIARNASQKWGALPPAERERIMLRCADVLESRVEQLFDLVIDESGSTVQKARYEITYTASLLRTAAGEARRLYGDTFPNDKPHRLSVVLREPLGVVVAISPYNAPLVLLAKMVVFALAVGNAVIAKPSEETPLIAIEFAKILHEGGMPNGVFQVLTGYGAEVGNALVEHPHVNGIAFTGSTHTGIRIGQNAMKTMKRLQLELGGKNPLIILNDMDVHTAAEIASVGAYYHAGQICMSGSRIIAEKNIADAFAEALAKKARSLRVGNLRDPQTAYGALINANAFQKVASHVQSAVGAGTEVLAGGTGADGWTYQPTVLYDPPQDNVAWREETFGPVASIVVAGDVDHAIAIANDSVFGLSAGVLTRDIQKGLQIARQVKAGAVHVGMHPFQSDALAPVGGFGMSGIGRSGGKYSVEHFTELKWISIELGETPRPF